MILLTPKGNGGSTPNTNLTLKINPRRYEYLRKELRAEKLYIVYEDERAVIVAGLNGSEKPRMVKVPKAWLLGDVKALTSVVPHR